MTAGVEQGGVGRQVDGLHRHLALDHAVIERRVDLVRGAVGRRVALGHHPVGIVGRDLRRQFRLAQRQRGGDAHERLHPHGVFVADARQRRQLQELAGGELLVGDLQAVRLACGARTGGGIVAAPDLQRAVDRARDAQFIGGGGERLPAVERDEEGAAHEEGRGQTGEDRARDPTQRHLPAIKDVLATIGAQRRRIAEVDRVRGVVTVCGLHRRRRAPSPVLQIWWRADRRGAFRRGRRSLAPKPGGRQRGVVRSRSCWSPRNAVILRRARMCAWEAHPEGGRRQWRWGGWGRT